VDSYHLTSCYVILFLSYSINKPATFQTKSFVGEVRGIVYR